MKIKSLRIFNSVKVGSTEITYADDKAYDVYVNNNQFLIVNQKTKEFALTTWTNVVYAVPDCKLEDVLEEFQVSGQKN